MRRQVPASSLGRAEEYTPGFEMECEMNEVPSTTTSSQSVMWPVSPARPPMMQRLPSTLLPAMALCAAIAECAPMRQLWAIMIRLSSFTPSSMTVSSIAPRSIVVLAPISTSSPMVTPPICGTLIHVPLSGA